MEPRWRCSRRRRLRITPRPSSRWTFSATTKMAVGTTDAASAGVITPQLIDDRAILRPGEVLEYIPGMIVTQHSGAGKANQYFLRGFNLDHGTDFDTYVAGMPVNMRYPRTRTGLHRSQLPDPGTRVPHRLFQGTRTTRPRAISRPRVAPTSATSAR